MWLDLTAVERPRLLISGTTGSGKTMAAWWIMYRLMAQNTPRTLRLLLGSAKLFQLEPWAHCAHLLHPPERRPVELVKLLLWAQAEMERRMETGERPDGRTGPPRLLLVLDDVAHLAKQDWNGATMRNAAARRRYPRRSPFRRSRNRRSRC